nr:YtcA family lipoprotein [Parapusillimonas granuli]
MAVPLSGCAQARAPSFYMAGSYFPAWLLCAVIGIAGAAFTRVLFIRIGLDDILPLRLLVYSCIAFIIAMVVGLCFFIE